MYRVYAKKDAKCFHKSDCYLVKNKKTDFNKYSIEEALISGKVPCLKCFDSTIEDINSKVESTNNDFLNAHLSKKEKIIWLYNNSNKELFKEAYYLYKSIPDEEKDNCSSYLIEKLLKQRFPSGNITLDFYNVFTNYLKAKEKNVSFTYDDLVSKDVLTNETKDSKLNSKRIAPSYTLTKDDRNNKIDLTDSSWEKQIKVMEFDERTQNQITELLIKYHNQYNGDRYLFKCTLILDSNTIIVYLDNGNSSFKIGCVRDEYINFICEKLDEKRSIFIVLDKYINKCLYFSLVHIADNDKNMQNLLLSKFNNAIFCLKNSQNAPNTIESISWRKRVVGTKYELKGNNRSELYKKLAKKQNNKQEQFLFDCKLEYENDNPYDSNAIKVSVILDKVYFIGYIAKEDQTFINNELDNKTSMKLILINNYEQNICFDIVHIKSGDSNFYNLLYKEYKKLIETRKNKEKQEKIIDDRISNVKYFFDDVVIPFLLVVMALAIVISPIVLIANGFSGDKSDTKQATIENKEDTVTDSATISKQYDYRVYDSTTHIYSTNSHVGHDWGTKELTCYKNDSEVDTRNITLKPGDKLYFTGIVYEGDSSPDSADFESYTKVVSLSDLQKDEIEISSYDAIVEEDRGRYAGEQTNVTVTLILSPVD